MRNNSVLMITKVPPPIGGVSIHSLRLKHYLELKGIKVKILNPCLTNIIKIILESLQVDIIHIHSLKFLSFTWLYFMLLRLLGNKRVILTVHTMRKIPKLAKFLFMAPSLIITTNDHLRSIIVDIINNSNRVDVVSPFLPPFEQERNFFEELNKSESEFLDSGNIISFNAFKVVFENGIDLYGIDTIIGAFSVLLRDKLQLKLCMCIPGIDYKGIEYIKTLLQKYDVPVNCVKVITNRIWFVDVLKKSFIFVRPTRSDGNSLSVMEALQYNVRVVASDCVQRPQGVILFQTGNMEDLAAKIRDIALNKEKVFSYDFLNCTKELMNLDKIINYYNGG